MAPDGPGAFDWKMMGLALRAARRGRPSPNPHVGAVVARDGDVIAVDHHRRAGMAHAEVGALDSAGGGAQGATLYVTFEPCNHQGRTGPCTVTIIRAGVARVVIGCRDPAPHVPGAIDRLRAAGIEVTVGVREREARQLIVDFAKHITTGLPYVTLKAAVTLDGRTATATGDSRWITGERARREAHRLRDRHDAVLVGVGTVLADDPRLTVRWIRGVDPLRIVLDPALRIPSDARLLTTDSRLPALIAHAPDAPAERVRALQQAGAELVEVPRAERGLELASALRLLGERGVVRLLVEGGATVHGALLEAGLADAAAIFVAPRILGDPTATPLAAAGTVERVSEAWHMREPRVRRLGPDVLFAGALAKGEE